MSSGETWIVFDNVEDEVNRESRMSAVKVPQLKKPDYPRTGVDWWNKI